MALSSAAEAVKKYLQKISSARYGSEVRSSIHDGIKACADRVDEGNNQIYICQNQIDGISGKVDRFTKTVQEIAAVDRTQVKPDEFNTYKNKVTNLEETVESLKSFANSSESMAEFLEAITGVSVNMAYLKDFAENTDTKFDDALLDMYSRLNTVEAYSWDSSYANAGANSFPLLRNDYIHGSIDKYGNVSINESTYPTAGYISRRIDIEGAEYAEITIPDGVYVQVWLYGDGNYLSRKEPIQHVGSGRVDLRGINRETFAYRIVFPDSLNDILEFDVAKCDYALTDVSKLG